MKTVCDKDLKLGFCDDNSYIILGHLHTHQYSVDWTSTSP